MNCLVGLMLRLLRHAKDYDASMIKCWAKSLGDCDGGMSGEHVFSNALFKAGCSCPIVIEGVHRINCGAPTYGAEKSNILCRHHNSLLSPLDATIGKVAQFQASISQEDVNGSLFIEGELLERWLLKTVINIGAAGWGGAKKRLPSADIVKAIFGHSRVPEKLGLYSVDGVDPKHHPSGGASFSHMYVATSRGKVLAGAYVTVHGMPLLASFHTDLVSMLETEDAPQDLKRFSDTRRHLYHPGAIVITRKRGQPVFIGLSWNGLLRFADGTTETFPKNQDKGL